MADPSEMTDVFSFMELRAPYSPEAKALRQSYIRDDVIGQQRDRFGRFDSDLQTPASLSGIGRFVYECVFCNLEREPSAATRTAPETSPASDRGYGKRYAAAGRGPAGNGNGSATLTETGTAEIAFAAGLDEMNEELVDDLIGRLPPYSPMCLSTDGYTSYAAAQLNPLIITEMEKRAYILQDGVYYLLPERLEQIDGLDLAPQIAGAYLVMARALKNFDLAKLVKELEDIFDTRPLRKLVLEKGAYTAQFLKTKRLLFDTLYLLYILRRRTAVNLEYVIDGLRVLHALEALAIDDLLRLIQNGPASQLDVDPKKWTPEALYPDMAGWNTADVLPLIQNKDDFEAYLMARPVIHPIFARLMRYRFPFNELKPIGIGDLKVVKQWLVGYQPGEISHVENILKGETNQRSYRTLDKSEDTYSFTSSSKESSQKDTQTTDRFELKREAENIVKTELAVGANAGMTFTYLGTGYTIVSNVSANFGYKRDTSDTSKLSSSYARETVSKAVEQVEKNTSEARTMTLLREVEEVTRHGFDNKNGTGHISGIYRWIDKKYKAQLFNYGKRMMFEFIIPEPAAFLVESRLRAFEGALEVPQPPKYPSDYPRKVSLSFTAAQIDQAKFDELRDQYDLADMAYPVDKWVEFVDTEKNQALFEETGLPGGAWHNKTYACKVNKGEGYTLTTLKIIGKMEFAGKKETDTNKQNTLEVFVNGQRVFDPVVDNNYIFWVYEDKNFQAGPLLPFDGDNVTVDLGFWDIYNYQLSLFGELKMQGDALDKWQGQVFKRVIDAEQQRVNRENQEIELKYNKKMSDYQNRLGELRAMSVNALLQGQSEAFNRELIRAELKKHCLTLLTREFDDNPADDLIASFNPVKRVPGSFQYRRFRVTEDDPLTKATAGFEEINPNLDININYPAIDIEQAKKKGRYVQFLEQAFEWQQLAYIFYPYYWAKQPDWIAMMSRSDDADPNFTAFLQAGSARVLLAVTPAYDQAVLHFLATREPWDGGPAPVIGDPLFIPLHEEIRKSQDDLYNAIPDGDPWSFTLPTALVYLDGSGADLPTFDDPMSGGKT